MKKSLIDEGILLPSGEVCKDKINLISGAITLPFAEAVWVMTDGDMETINRLTGLLVSMNTSGDRGKLFSFLQTLYGLYGFAFPDEATLIATHKDALEYFIFSFTCDFGEIIKDYIAEERLETA